MACSTNSALDVCNIFHHNGQARISKEIQEQRQSFRSRTGWSFRRQSNWRTRRTQSRCTQRLLLVVRHKNST
jgi:hypothetical protein